MSSYYLLVSSSGLLLVIGLTMVFSATSVRDFKSEGNPYAALTRQALFAVIGLVAFWICQRLPGRTFRQVAPLVLGAAVVLLLLVNGLIMYQTLRDLKVARLGPFEASGSWLFIGPFQLQPSELAKFGLVLWGADVLARKGAELGWWRELLSPLFPVVAMVFLLVGYDDLGTMLILLSLLVGLLWAAGVRLRVFGVLGLVAAGGVALLVAATQESDASGGDPPANYRLARLTAFLNPGPDCKQFDCYQATQAKYAIADGGWFGAGLGRGSLKWDYLPEAHNDFIFAVIAEELGVVGCAVVLALLAVLTYTGFRIARRVGDPFRRLAAASATTWLVGQAVINIGGVVGLLPITGLPLPFISDGGSALVVTLAAVGMLASFARAEPDAARALHARPPAKWVRLLWAPLPPLPPERSRAKSTAGGSAGAAARTPARPARGGGTVRDEKRRR
ncbi:FtsW/RodA/SpoVE family cell cycle protein [Rhizomonospora bruguierae]|uniref:FtsW/RodA/SpoVE family cell cycle protein n=1 Tax=Rhizomonospora bruguierae TaxID=1581705 RepID=UPI001BCE2AE1|nr:putative peptidoglycan glycosyltransferase FtsW [Micromonospora sp. NBRC 107566]